MANSRSFRTGWLWFIGLCILVGLLDLGYVYFSSRGFGLEVLARTVFGFIIVFPTSALLAFTGYYLLSWKFKFRGLPWWLILPIIILVTFFSLNNLPIIQNMYSNHLYFQEHPELR